MANAIKLQWHKQARSGYDQTGGEPVDDHATVRLPGMAHGIEQDPATLEAVELIKREGDELNETLNERLSAMGFDHDKFGYFGFYLMDSDGKV